MKSKEVFPGVFSRHARAYRDRALTPEREPAAAPRRSVVERVAPRPGERVLDVACGPGTLTFLLAEAVGPAGRVVAIHLADGMLELLAEIAPENVDLHRMDMEELEFPDATFDAVSCGHGLQFAPDLSRALAEALRVLKPGGRFAASVPAPGGGFAPALADALERSLPPAPAVVDREATKEAVGDPERLAGALAAAGFTAVTATREEESTDFPDAEAVVDRTYSWWSCASRLEQLDSDEQARLRTVALRAVRESVTGWPLMVTSASLVAFGVRPG